MTEVDESFFGATGELSALSVTSHGEIWFNDELFSLYTRDGIIMKLKVEQNKRSKNTSYTHFMISWLFPFDGHNNGTRRSYAFATDMFITFV